MPWVRFDDTFPVHRKVDGLSDTAFRLHVSAIFWCARNLTDGAVPEEDLELVTARVRAPARFATELVRRGLWHKQGHDCPECPQIAGSWVIHGYLEFQPSKEKVLAERRGSAERQRAWRDRHKELPDNASSNGVSNSGTNAAPSRPVPKGRGGKGDLKGGTSVTRASPEPPSPKCQDHHDDPDPPPCGACGDARRTRAAWDRDQAAQAALAQQAEAHARAEVSRLAIDACGLCDHQGYLPGGTVCRHDPGNADRAKRGAAAARAALTPGAAA